jgi:CRP-like cAMP-binding protein
MSALPKLREYEGFNNLNGLTPDFGAADFAASANIRRLKAGETLFVEGDAAPFCYQVASGVIKEYNTLEDGRRQVADFYGVGELFGISELDEQLHTAEAITDCTVRCYPRESFLHAISSSPELSYHFLDTIMTRLHRARERMVMLGRMSAVQRITAFLLRLSVEQATTTNVQFLMSRQDIADHLGLTIETVCRVLTALKKKGLIIMPSARVFSIPDEASLDGVAHGGRNLH